jgi:hypothetical protein
MAYTPNTLAQLYGGPIEGGFKNWVYTSTDAISTILAAGYFATAGQMGMGVGDVIWVINQSSPVSAPATQLQCTAVTTSTTAGFAQPTGPVTVQQTGVTTIGLGMLPRNLIDCGDFTTNPWQIATSFNGTSATPTLTADRWNANSGASLTWTAGRASNTTVQGFSASYQWGRSVGDTHTTGLSFGQVIESLDSVRTQGLPVALSFWNAADANFAAGASGGTFVASVLAGTGIDDTSGKMFSGAWTGMTTIATQVITPTTTMARIGPIGGVVPTNATQLGVAFSYVPTTAATSPGLTAGAHESLQFMGVQLEIGGMTAFEHTEVAEVVNIATRYLQVISEPTTGIALGAALSLTSTTATVHVPLPSPMRKAPTLTFTAGGFIVTDNAQGAHTISAASLTGATTGAITLATTAATTLTAGQMGFLQGRTTGLGEIVLGADY